MSFLSAISAAAVVAVITAIVIAATAAVVHAVVELTTLGRKEFVNRERDAVE